MIPNRLSVALLNIDLDKCFCVSPLVPATFTAAAVFAVSSDVMRIEVTSPNKIESFSAMTIS